MRNKIGKKLTVANALILVLALSIFCLLALSIFNNYMKNSIKEQLITENKVMFRLAQLNVLTDGIRNRNNDEDSNEFRQPTVYNNLIESVSLVYQKSDKTNKYRLVYTTQEDFEVDYKVFELKDEIMDAEDRVIEMNIDSVNYYCTMLQSKPRGENNVQTATISLIPLSSVKSVNRKYIGAFLLTTIILVLFSVIVVSVMSSKITKPIVKLTSLTKEYSQRNFKNKYIANTNDEVEDLSKAIVDMANNLEDSDMQREKMFRHISHELKTPLTAIYGYAEGIKNSVFKDADEPLDIIMSESLRIKKLTEDIIYLSKLESHIEVFKFTQCDISKIMVKAIRSIESIAIMKDIDIQFMPEKLSLVEADEEKLHRALINILSNCVKHTKDVIDIRIMENEDNIQITIADNGDGFKEEDIKNLLSGMTKEKSNGSGIGLSIVNEIIMGHKGEFYIGNNKLGGAIFNIYLKK